MENGGLYFRVVRDGGRWVYRRGRRVISRHGSLDEALEQARRDAAAHRPSQVIVHSEDGEVMFVEPFD